MVTVEAMKERIREIEAEETKLRRMRYEFVLAIEEQGGNGDSREAKFARAVLAGDLAYMNHHCAENDADHYRRTGKWTEHQAEAERIVAAEGGTCALVATCQHDSANDCDACLDFKLLVAGSPLPGDGR